MQIPGSFKGTLLDFGCGLGDAIPIYHVAFPKARLIGVDISPDAIEKCKSKYGHLAEYLAGDYLRVPAADVIVSSNVFEHLSNDKEIARFLLSRCSDLYIITPYRERITQVGEHVNAYETTSFSAIGDCTSTVYPCRGWSQYGFRLWYQIYFENLLRPLLGKAICPRAKQIMFHLTNNKQATRTE